MAKTYEKKPGKRQDRLNRCMPIAYEVALGDVLVDLITQHNALVAACVAANVAGVTAAMEITPLETR